MYRAKSAAGALAKNITKGVATVQRSVKGQTLAQEKAPRQRSRGKKSGSPKKKSTASTTTTTTKLSEPLAMDYSVSKAGLQQVDKHYVESVIAEASRGSRFTQYKVEKQKERNVRNEALLQKAEIFKKKLSAEERRTITAETDRIVAELEATRAFSVPVPAEGDGAAAPSQRTVKKKLVFMHFDMDMFYAAVEEKRDPTLKDVPFAVGSKSMLSTSNYIARQYGVRSGMPGFIARRLCPELVLVPVDMPRYKAEAEVIRRTVAAYDPYFVTVGLDEMTINATDYLHDENERRRRAASHAGQARPRLLTPEGLCAQIRADVFAATQLTCSGGIGPTPALCKLASNVEKPNGQHYFNFTTREEVLAYMATLPVREVSGIGFAQEQKLKALGVVNCSDMLTHKDLLYYLFGGDSKTFRFYISAGLGLMKTHVDRALTALQLRTQQQAVRQQVLQQRHKGAAPVADEPALFAIGGGPPRKSIGKEVTLNERMKEEQFGRKLQNILLHLASGAQETLLRERLVTQQVQLVLKDIYFREHSFRFNLPEKTNDLKCILDGCKQIIVRETLSALRASRAGEKRAKQKSSTPQSKGKNPKKKKKGSTTAATAVKPSYNNPFRLDRLRLVGVRLTRLTSALNDADALKRATAFMKQSKQPYIFAGSAAKKKKTASSAARRKKGTAKTSKRSHTVLVKKASKEVKRAKRKAAVVKV